MDSEVLVERQKEDGLALIAELSADGFDVTVAFWAQLSDGQLWYLYVGTKALESMNMADAWRAFYRSMKRLGDCSIMLSEIRLIGSIDPIAIAAAGARRRSHDGHATRYLRSRLANLDIEEAYIYPDVAGPLTRELVASRVAGLMAATADESSSLFDLRDGPRIQGVPIGLHRTAAGGLELVLHDPESNLDRSISADEVIAIQPRSHRPRLAGVAPP